MEPTISAIIYPPSTAGTPLGPGIPLAQLYELSDRMAEQYSDEQIIASAKAIWTAPVYGHYILSVQRSYVRDPVTGAIVLDHILFTFTCKFDPGRCKMRTRRRKATGTYSTNNLKKVVKACDKRRQIPDSLAITNQSKSSYSHTRLRAFILMWCAAGQRSFDAIEDSNFLTMVQILRPDAKVPSLTTITSDLAHIYTQVTSGIREKFELCIYPAMNLMKSHLQGFQETDSGIHLAIDGWPSPLTDSFVGVVVFWREGVKIWRAVLDFIHLTGNHTNAYASERIIDCLTYFGAIKQIRSVCLNQPRENDAIIRELALSLPNFNGPESRINCGTHAIDLIARSFTTIFTHPVMKQRRIATNSRVNASIIGSLPGGPSTTGKPLDDSNDPEIILEELDGVLRFPVEVDEGKESRDSGIVQKAITASASHMKAHYGISMTNEYAREVQDLFPKICGFFNHLYESDSDFITFAEIRESVEDSASDAQIPGDVDPTRWEDCLQCSESFQSLRVPIEMMISDESYNLSKYKLTEYQWLLNEELTECMQVFREPALFLSQKNTPVIHEVLPTFTLLKYRLERMRDNANQLLDKHPAIRIAAQSSIITLDEQMKIMAESEVCSTATILCPYYKLAWFIEQGYEPARIEELSRTLYRHFARANPPPSTTATAQPIPTTPAQISAPQPISPWMRKPAPTRRPSVPCTPGQGWVTAYLSSPVVSKDSIDRMGGVLNYWIYEQQRGSPLARVALDLLSAPGKSFNYITHIQSHPMVSKASSVDTNRSFSGVGTAANYRQHRMSLSTFRAKMAVGSWYTTPLLPEIEEVVDILNDFEGSDPSSLEL